MKLAAAVILSFAVLAIVYAEDGKPAKETKLPVDMEHPHPMPSAAQMGRMEGLVESEAPAHAQRRGGGDKGKGSSQPSGWGPPPGWGAPPPVHGWGPPPAPLMIPIPIPMGWGGLRGGYGGPGYGAGPY